jgi:serine/threonine-protein kinase
MNCPGCAARLYSVSDFCPHCGLSLEPALWARETTGHEMTQILPETEPGPLGQLLEGRYRVDAFIARGGMGVVFRGTDTKLGRKVAIKFLAEELRQNRSVVQRFMREAQTAASMDHPAIIAVHSVGDHQGRPYIVMKFVQGQTVAELIRAKGRLTVPQAIHILSQVCDGLDHIHGQGYVHRDIKPQNLMVDPAGRCVILDFGILRLVDSTMTTSGLMVGTPAYVAPEQARDPKLADRRSDLYSLGITFFEMMTGRLPFRATSALDLLIKQTSEPPPPASSIAPDLPAGVDSLLRKALAKDPAERFQTARELKEALRSIVSSESLAAAAAEPLFALTAEPESLATPASQVGATGVAGESLVRRSRVARRGARTAGIAAVILLVGGAALASWLAFREPGGAPPRPLPAVAPPAAPVPAPSPAVARPPPAAFPGAPARPAPGVAPKPDPAQAEDRSDDEPRRAARRLRPPPREEPPAPLALPPAARDVLSAAPPAPKPAMAYLSVLSRPEGARVQVGGRTLGLTPLERAKLPAGSYEVSVEKKGYHPWSESVRIEAGETRTLSARLEAKEATLRIVSLYEGRGTWAAISVDGEQLGNTHAATHRVKPGTYTVAARREGYRGEARQVTVGPGETQRVELHLRRIAP